jgi:hypothetical protein
MMQLVMTSRGTGGHAATCAGHAGAARRCTKRHRRPWAQPGPPAVDGPRRLSVDACASRHRRPRDHSWDRGLCAGRRSCSSRSGKLRVVACTPRHRRPRDHSWDRGLRAGRRSCTTRSGPTRLRMPTSPTLAPPAAGVGGTRKGAVGCGSLRASRRSCVTRNGHIGCAVTK